MGIPQELVGTVEYSVYPEQVFNPERGDTVPRVTGYVVRNVVRVEVRQVDQVGRILDAVLAKGANQINSLQFYASSADEARRSALAQAIVRATGDACAMARAAGGNIGSLLEISELTGPVPMRGYGGLMMERAAAAPTPVEPGEQRLAVSVVTRWSFRSVATTAQDDPCRRR
jgi:uncharacterized protein YggE